MRDADGEPLRAGASCRPAAGASCELGSGFPLALSQSKGFIESAAAKAGVPANMLAAQIWQESRGNLAAVTTNGGNGLTDTGLRQVNPNTFGELFGSRVSNTGARPCLGLCEHL